MAEHHIWNRIKCPDLFSCWEWQGASRGWGHGCAKFNGKVVAVHRWVYEQLVGPIPPDAVLRHTCDNPKCCNPAHLLIGSHADNVRDRVERKRSAIGERNGRSKLTAKQVKEICERLDAGDVRTALSRRYGVDQKVIRDIEIGKTWRHVTGRSHENTPPPTHP